MLLKLALMLSFCLVFLAHFDPSSERLHLANGQSAKSEIQTEAKPVSNRRLEPSAKTVASGANEGEERRASPSPRGMTPSGEIQTYRGFDTQISVVKIDLLRN